MKPFDVYAFGVIAPSILYLLQGQYPARSGYAEFEQSYRNLGGEAANSSVVLARLGAAVKLDGNWINPDEDALFIKEIFEQHQIDISRIAFKECRGPKEMLVVDSDSRTIFGTYSQLMEDQSWNFPTEEDIQTAKIICLDPFFGEASFQAAEWAQKHQKPVVTVDVRFDDPIFAMAAVAIISAEYLRDTYPQMNIDSIIDAYTSRSGGITIFTFGHKEIRYGSREGDFKSFTPYQIDPIDTTGAGDSFRAGVIFGLLRNWPMEKTIPFASALAAMVCRSIPGVLNSPDYEQVLAFMANYNAKG